MNIAFIVFLLSFAATDKVKDKMEQLNEQQEMREFDRYARSLEERGRYTLGEVYNLKKNPTNKRRPKLSDVK